MDEEETCFAGSDHAGFAPGENGSQSFTDKVTMVPPRAAGKRAFAGDNTFDVEMEGFVRADVHSKGGHAGIAIEVGSRRG